MDKGSSVLGWKMRCSYYDCMGWYGLITEGIVQEETRRCKSVWLDILSVLGWGWVYCIVYYKIEQMVRDNNEQEDGILTWYLASHSPSLASLHPVLHSFHLLALHYIDLAVCEDALTSQAGA